MSHEAVEWVLANDRSSGGYGRLLIAIADCIRANEGGWGWSTKKRLMERGGVTEDGYKKGIIRLRQLGYIEVDRNGAANARHSSDATQAEMSAQRRANGYYFVPLLDDQRHEEWEALRARNGSQRKALAAKSAAAKTPPQQPVENSTHSSTRGAPSAPPNSPDGAPSAPPDGAPSAPPDGAPSAPPYSKDDPLVDPLVDPGKKSSVSNQYPAKPAVDDDDQESDRVQGSDKPDGPIAAAIDLLAKHDLAEVRAAEGHTHVRFADRWLETARATRRDQDGPTIAAAVAAGEHDPTALAALVLGDHTPPAPGPPARVTAAESMHPVLVAQRLADERANNEPSTGTPTPAPIALDNIRQARELLRR